MNRLSPIVSGVDNESETALQPFLFSDSRRGFEHLAQLLRIIILGYIALVIDWN